jgi:hypothetical protein
LDALLHYWEGSVGPHLKNVMYGYPFHDFFEIEKVIFSQWNQYGEKI